MSDWSDGTSNDNIDCSPGAAPPEFGNTTYPYLAGICTITVPLPAGTCENDKFYVNVHLDYGLKGKDVDGTDGDEPPAPDRYDGMAPASPWGTYDAYVNVPSTEAPSVVAINDCTPYTFSHGSGDFEFDAVYSVNTFKKIAGVFSQTTSSASGVKIGVSGVTATLTRKDTGEVVATGQGDADGYILLAYKHTGKVTWFTVTLSISGFGTTSQDVQLKANGWAEVSYDVTTGIWYVQSVGTK
jgi:hypothetical protein